MKVIPLFLLILLLQLKLSANDSLVLWINFNENSFDNLNKQLIDQSAFSNNASLYGKVDFSMDRFNNQCGAFNFNGNSFFYIPNSTSLSSPRNEITISAWVKINQGADFFNQWMTIICKGDDRSENLNSPHYRMQATAQTASLNSSLIVSVVPPINFNTWYHYVYVLKDNFFKIYLNSQLIKETYYNSTLNPNNLPLEIGRDLPGNAEYFNGNLDDLKIFNKGLSQAEIFNLYMENNSNNLFCEVGQDQIVKKPVPKNKNVGNSDISSFDVQDTVVVKSNSVFIYPHDNNIVDYDSVSIYLNGNLIVDSILLDRRQDPIPPTKLYKIDLSDKKRENFLVVKALNLGNDPPNTMALRVIDGFQEQEININSTLKSNGALLIILE